MLGNVTLGYSKEVKIKTRKDAVELLTISRWQKKVPPLVLF